jgi:hypothetical protein
MYARQLSNRSMFHAGRYLDDKEICYLPTVIVTANVCQTKSTFEWSWLNTGDISVLKSRHLSLKLVYLLYSRLIHIIVMPKLDNLLAKFFTQKLL